MMDLMPCVFALLGLVASDISPVSLMDCCQCWFMVRIKLLALSQQEDVGVRAAFWGFLTHLTARGMPLPWKSADKM